MKVDRPIQIGVFGPINCYIWETIRDMAIIVTIKEEQDLACDLLNGAISIRP